MKKYIGLIVAGILIAGVSYGFMSMKGQEQKKSEPAAQLPSSGIAFPDMMGQLSRSMAIWSKLNANEKKEAISAVVAVYKNRDNVAILKDAEFYTGKIDETLQTNPSVANLDILTLLRILSVMEYDFYNGQNKDALAKEVLGEKGFAENQMRRRFVNAPVKK